MILSELYQNSLPKSDRSYQIFPFFENKRRNPIHRPFEYTTRGYHVFCYVIQGFQCPSKYCEWKEKFDLSTGNFWVVSVTKLLYSPSTPGFLWSWIYWITGKVNYVSAWGWSWSENHEARLKVQNTHDNQYKDVKMCHSQGEWPFTTRFEIALQREVAGA